MTERRTPIMKGENTKFKFKAPVEDIEIEQDFKFPPLDEGEDKPVFNPKAPVYEPYIPMQNTPDVDTNEGLKFPPVNDENVYKGIETFEEFKQVTPDESGLKFKPLPVENYCRSPKTVELGLYSEVHPIPLYAHEGDSGFDLPAYILDENGLTFKPLETHLVNTGIYAQIPEGYEIQIRSRSGLAAKRQLFVLNSPGTVDRTYTGELKVILTNLSKEKQVIKDGDRIAQAVLVPVAGESVTAIKKLSTPPTSDKRGVAGFGSTGV